MTQPAPAENHEKLLQQFADLPDESGRHEFLSRNPTLLRPEIDIRSTFSNYGAPPVWLAAPGEGIMTTYPFGTWAAGWGTSFSAPLVSGTAALMASTSPTTLSLKSVLTGGGAKTQAGSALSHTQPISDSQMGNGRLDTYQAMQAWRKAMGLK